MGPLTAGERMKTVCGTREDIIWNRTRLVSRNSGLFLKTSCITKTAKHTSRRLRFGVASVRRVVPVRSELFPAVKAVLSNSMLRCCVTWSSTPRLQSNTGHTRLFFSSLAMAGSYVCLWLLEFQLQGGFGRQTVHPPLPTSLLIRYTSDIQTGIGKEHVVKRNQQNTIRQMLP